MVTYYHFPHRIISLLLRCVEISCIWKKLVAFIKKPEGMYSHVILYDHPIFITVNGGSCSGFVFSSHRYQAVFTSLVTICEENDGVSHGNQFSYHGKSGIL